MLLSSVKTGQLRNVHKKRENFKGLTIMKSNKQFQVLLKHSKEFALASFHISDKKKQLTFDSLSHQKECDETLFLQFTDHHQS